MPVKVVFTCETCGVRPDPETQESYGTLGWHPWAMGPHPWAGRRGSERARRLARSLRSTMGAPGA